MKLKFVGSRPVVTKGGVSFDESKPDKYTLFGPLLDILNELEAQKKGQDIIDISDMKINPYKDSKILENIQIFCPNLKKIEEKREAKANERIDNFVENLKDGNLYNKDDMNAFLANIEYMRDYYLHYVTNESVYNSLLDVLADKIHAVHFNKLIFPIGKNHGLVLSHLIPILVEHKPPYDATLSVDEVDSNRVGILNMNRSRPLDI